MAGEFLYPVIGSPKYAQTVFSDKKITRQGILPCHCNIRRETFHSSIFHYIADPGHVLYGFLPPVCKT